MRLQELFAAALLQIALSPSPIGIAAYEMVQHFLGEWTILANLLLLLLGFAVLSNQFERSRLPEAIPSHLPGGWIGGVVLLALFFCSPFFLDNIAGAIIGGVAARHGFLVE